MTTLFSPDIRQKRIRELESERREYREYLRTQRNSPDFADRSAQVRVLIDSCTAELSELHAAEQAQTTEDDDTDYSD